MNRVGILAALVFVAGLPSSSSADEGDARGIPGWVERNGDWFPLEPFVAGQPRATGLQAPFPAMRSLDTNPMSAEKVALGKLLFFDPIVSGDNLTSCAHCHHPDHGFADGRKLSMGFGGQGVGPERSGGDVLGAAPPACGTRRIKSGSSGTAGPMTSKPRPPDQLPTNTKWARSQSGWKKSSARFPNTSSGFKRFMAARPRRP